MPTFSTTGEEFLTQMTEGQTPFTKRMNDLFANPGALKTQFPSEYRILQTPGGLDKISAEIRDLLKQSDEEFVNIDGWPAEQKEQVRRKLVQAIDEDRAIRFSWELYRGEYEAVEIVDPGPVDRITITLRSPWKKVKLEGSTFVQRV